MSEGGFIMVPVCEICGGPTELNYRKIGVCIVVVCPACDERLSELPPADCCLGYTNEQIDHLFGTAGAVRHNLNQFLEGSTGGVCDGRRWNPEMHEYEDTLCGPHGCTTYGTDLRRFLAGFKHHFD